MSSLRKTMKAICSPRGRKPKMRPTVSAPSSSSSTLSIPKPRPSRFGSTESTSTNLKVCVRIRPINETESSNGRRVIVKPVDSRMLIFDPKEEEEPFFYQGVQQPVHNYLKKANKEMQFIFDHVFGTEASNGDVFLESTKEIINSLMEGYNCSVFVYGATGAGKTFTMLGCPEVPGITYLTMNELFENINLHRQDREFEICVSYLEIYNENVYDLLRPSDSPLHLREDGKYGVQIAGLSSKSIQTAQELLDMLDKGNKNRTQHPTDANAESSRSHAVFQVYVKMRAKATNQAKLVKLSMIDLAGSERASATNCKGDRFKEGANINRSLLALGNCINQLADGSKFIPYRDSKLTRLLKDSLGGNCRTVMIANVAPTISSYEDTYNTLKYATRANKIQQRMKKNIISCDGHVAQYIKQAEELKERVLQLESELAKSKEKECLSDGVDIASVKLLNKWSDRLNSEGEKHFGRMEEFLRVLKKQRNLIARASRKSRTAAALNALCNVTDITDDQLKETYKMDIQRLNTSIETLVRQANAMQTELEAIQNKIKISENNFKSSQMQALTECPLSEHIISSLHYRTKLILSQAKMTNLERLSSSQYNEVTNLNLFIKDSLEMLKKYHLRLKSQGIFTASMSKNYDQLINQARNSKIVTWEDEKENDDCNDPIIGYLLNLDSNIVNVPENIISNIMNFGVEETNEIMVEDETSDEIENNEVMTNSTDDLNSTYVEPNPKSNMFPQNCIDDMIFELENSNKQYKQPKSINPGCLNSTLLLVQKDKAEESKKIINPFGIKTVLSEKTNTLTNEKLFIDSFKKPLGKITPFKKHDIKSGFGSSASRFQRPNIPSSNTQMGCKTMRTKERPALTAASVLPYRRPQPYKK